MIPIDNGLIWPYGIQDDAYHTSYHQNRFTQFSGFPLKSILRLFGWFLQGVRVKTSSWNDMNVSGKGKDCTEIRARRTPCRGAQGVLQKSQWKAFGQGTDWCCRSSWHWRRFLMVLSQQTVWFWSQKWLVCCNNFLLQGCITFCSSHTGRWGFLDFDKGATPSSSFSLLVSSFSSFAISSVVWAPMDRSHIASSGCCGPRLDPNRCQKKCPE